MPKSFFLVHAVIAEPLRDKFDHWYSTDHLPRAIRIFKCEKAWRFWSEAEPGVHYAVYQFADKARLDAAYDDSLGVTAAFNHIGFNWTAYFRALGRTRPIAIANVLAATSPSPPPIAAPCTLATTGLVILTSASSRSL